MDKVFLTGILMMRSLFSWRTTARICIFVLATAAIAALFASWRGQVDAPLSCSMGFQPLGPHNGYMQISVLGPHVTEETFEGKLFLYYSRDQSPPASMEIVRGGAGSYAPSVLSTSLVPFGDGLSSASNLPIGLPTPGVSQRRFPFDSPKFNLDFELRPAIRPAVVIIRNLSADFLPRCERMAVKWTEKNRLNVQIEFQRNPFVLVTVVVMALAAVIFASLLSLVRGREELAIATASYFFSIWSVRGIVSPVSLPYSTLLDLWMMGASLVALFVVMWRLTRDR